MIAFIGVRISWLIEARNALFASFASSASTPRLLQLRDVVVDGVVAGVNTVDDQRNHHDLDVDGRAVLVRALRHARGSPESARPPRERVPLLAHVRPTAARARRSSGRSPPRAVAELARRRWVPAGHALVGVHRHDRDRADLDERLEVLLLAVDLGRGVVLGRDVDHEALDVGRLAGGVPDDPGVVANPDDLPVLRRSLGTRSSSGRFPTRGASALPSRAVLVVGMENGRKERLLHPRLGRVAEHLLDPRADVRRRAGRVGLVGVHDERQLLDEPPIALLGCRECLEGASPARPCARRRAARASRRSPGAARSCR